MNLMRTSLYDRIGGRETLGHLLRHFYSDIRQHNLVGPIFNEHIRDWPAHLELIGSFLGAVDGRTLDLCGRNAGQTHEPWIECESLPGLVAIMGIQLWQIPQIHRGAGNDQSRS